MVELVFLLTLEWYVFSNSWSWSLQKNVPEYDLCVHSFDKCLLLVLDFVDISSLVVNFLVRTCVHFCTYVGIGYCTGSLVNSTFHEDASFVHMWPGVVVVVS